MFRVMSSTNNLSKFHATARNIGLSIDGECINIPIVHGDKNDIQYIISNLLEIDTIECQCSTLKGIQTWWEPELKTKRIHLDLSFIRRVPIVLSGNKMIYSPIMTSHDVYWQANLHKNHIYVYDNVHFRICTYDIEITEYA